MEFATSGSSSTGSSSREEAEARLVAVAATCTCCSLRCCCIRVPECALEAVARDDLRLPSLPRNNSSSKRDVPDRLLRFTEVSVG